MGARERDTERDTGRCWGCNDRATSVYSFSVCEYTQCRHACLVPPPPPPAPYPHVSAPCGRIHHKKKKKKTSSSYYMRSSRFLAPPPVSPCPCSPHISLSLSLSRSCTYAQAFTAIRTTSGELRIVELDGTKPAAVDHGRVPDDSLQNFLAATAKVGTATSNFLTSFRRIIIFPSDIRRNS